ncbi:MAG: hypothetical protein V3V96_14470 [Acidiferrobacterales bacterium]
MPSRTLDLTFPLGGLDRRLAVERQKPFTTPHAVNVRPEGAIEKRLRGGSRPGLVKSFATRVGSGNPVYMAAMMRSLASQGRLTFTEDFDGITEWTAMNAHDSDWAVDGTLTLSAGKAQVAQEDRGSVLNDGQLTNIEDSSNVINARYTVEVYVHSVPLDRIGHVSDISLYARLDDNVPTKLNSVVMRLRVEHGFEGGFQPRSRVRLFFGVGDDDSTIQRFYETLIDGELGDGWMRLTIESNTATAEWIPGPTSVLNTRQFETFPLPAPVANKSRVGLRIDNAGGIVGTSVVNLDDFVVRYFDASVTATIPPEAFIAASKHDGEDANAADEGQGSNIWYETDTGELTELPSKRDGSGGTIEETDLNHGVHIMAVDRLGKLYIADYGERQSGTDGTVSAAPFKTFDDAADTDWSEVTGIGVDEHGDWLEILSTGTGTTAILGVYKITAASAAGITVDTAMGTGAEIAVKYRIVRGPKIFDPSAGAGSRLVRWEPTDGDIPLGCTIIEVVNDRATLSGDAETPGVFYQSRQSDFLDFDYFVSTTDRTRAMSDLSTSSEGTQLSLPTSAIVAGTEDYVLFSAESEVSLLRGDLGWGGQLGNVSRQVGIGSRTAWCRVPDGSVVFLSRDGFYRFHPARGSPENLSRVKLPLDLLDVAQNSDFLVATEYDMRFQGVHIYVTPVTAGPTMHYWFDGPTESFWTVSLGSTNFDPFSIVFNAKTNQVLHGCRDGYVRHYDVGALDDDGVIVTKEVDYGPIPLNRGRAAIVDSLEITLDDSSEDVSWTFRTGNSPEEAFTANPRASGTAKAGRNYRQSVRHFGQYGFLRLSTTGAVRWAVEGISLRVLTVPAQQRRI